MKIIQDGKVFYLQNHKGEFWLGPLEPGGLQWMAPSGPGAMVPCWMTTSLESARAQAALLESDPDPTVWERIARELSRSSNEWLNSKDDPNGVNYAVALALDSAAKAILKAIHQPNP